jgi:PAS domain S-box-containing protein
MVVAGTCEVTISLNETGRSAGGPSERDQVLEAALVSIGDAVIVTDEKGQVGFLNPTAEALTGWSAAEAKRQPLARVFRIVNERTRALVENPVEKVLQSGLVQGLANHTVLLSHDGREIPIDDSAAPIRTADGRIGGIVLVFRDITERRRLELRAARLASIVESSDDAIISKRIDGQITSWNQAAERLLGYTETEIVGKPIMTIIPPELHEEEQHILRRLRRGERIEHFDTVRLAKDGRRIHVSLTVSPLKDSDGEVVGASKIMRDIRQRKELDTALASIGDAVIVTDERGLVRFLNPVAEALIGWSIADVKQQPLSVVFRIVNERTRALAENPVEKVLQSGLVQGLANHTVLLSHDGREIPIDDSAAPIRAPDGQVLGVVLVFRDITERRRLELRAARLASIVESSEDAIISKRIDGQITSWNQAAERLLGYSETEIVDKSIMTIIPPELHEEEQHILRRLRRGERIEHFDTVRLAKDGRRIEVSLTISPLRDDEGEVVGASKIMRDIRQRKELEKRLLEEHRLKDEFLAMLAHELRNPLAPIRTASEILSQAPADDAGVQTAVATIKRQVTHLTRLVDDLLDVSRITQGRIELQCRPIDVAGIIAQAVETVEPQLREKQHRLSVITATGYEPLYVNGDFARLVQCVGNILSNAAKFTDPGGEISVRMHTQSPAVVVEVADNGAGISPELVPRIFDLFVQGDRALDRAQGGLGIGLAVVKRLVEMHGGEVTAESPGLGQGSTFKIRLPRVARPRARSPEAAAFKPPPRRVLVVDDNADAANSLAALLSLQGHETQAVYSGREALERIESFRPHVALIDIGLPKMNGYELAKRLRETSDSASLRLVALTGYGQVEDREHARAAGFDDHLVKPVDMPALERALAGIESSGTKKR